jgi:DNA ligase-1
MSDPCYQVIRDLEVHNLRTNKEQIIAAQAELGNKEFFEGCRLALDSMITFGLKQIPEKTDEDGPGLPWDAFALAITGFTTRNVTGNTARDVVASMMKSATKAEWNDWYRRILIKDLRCGVSEKTINKVVSKINASYIIPVFSCQLAHDSANHESKVSGKKFIEVKLDGVRVITIVYPNGHVGLFSRNGKQLDNFPHIAEQIGKVANQFSQPMVLDGEVMSSSFQDLMKQVHRKSDVQSQDAILNLFDILPLDNFEQGGWDKTQTERSELVYKWHKTNKDVMPNVTVVGHELVDLDTPAGRTRYKEINMSAIAGGYEGIMLKDPLAPYECKRSTAWLKLKPFIEVSLEVVNVEEGTGKNVGRLGALVCSGQDDGKDITVNVGSGYSDDQRISFWNSRDQLPGQIVEVRADAVTQNQDGTFSLRFPRFLHFRGFDNGEKI